MLDNFVRVAAACPAVTVADPDTNIKYIIKTVDEAVARGAALVVLPELCITAYTCGDLFHNSTLIESAYMALGRLVDYSRGRWPLVIVGMPIAYNGALYNCGVAINDGRIIAAVPKTYLPGYNEFYEKRWFVAAPDTRGAMVDINGDMIPFGTDILLELDSVKVGIEICEDLWSPIPPSFRLALSGAHIIANLSASDDIVGKYDYLVDLVKQQSARCISAYVYSSAAYGESTTDLVFRAKAFVAENGTILAGGRRHPGEMFMADVDIAAIERDRRHIRTWADCAAREGEPAGIRVIKCTGKIECPAIDSLLMRDIEPLPFVPPLTSNLDARCQEILWIQASGLHKRLDVTHAQKIVIGISGGLDSTLALLVAVRAFDVAKLDRKGIIGVTMPGFGTTDRTRDNAIALMEALGVTAREVSIAAAVTQHFNDIGHDPAIHDVTYENSQARERTQILMDIANQEGCMVLGTGDLSELALGWATYNGDHMSMYGVNSGVPKTLVRSLVSYYADVTTDTTVRDILRDIVDTPISPELIPADSSGKITQCTEDLVGPYELHDFFIYYMLRYGFSPRRIFRLARQAFDGRYDGETIAHWMRTFFRRFFTQQFKRSCLPDGPKVGSVTLSPRGDWRMPSDAAADAWLRECDSLL